MIIISKYNPKWPQEFEIIKSSLHKILGDLALRIDHIGSTSVPGLGAKDVIDVQITAKKLNNEIQQTLANAGYKYSGTVAHDHVPPGENDDPKLWEKFLFNEPEGQRRANIHIRIEGRANQRYAILFRDYLRTHPASAESYAELKRRLAHNLADLKKYAEVKDPAVDLIYLAAEEWATLVKWKQGQSDA